MNGMAAETGASIPDSRPSDHQAVGQTHSAGEPAHSTGDGPQQRLLGNG